MQHKIQRFIDEIKQAVASEHLLLPSRPDVALKLNQACSQPDISSEKLADVISQDPAMSVRLLQMANSSLYRTEHSTDCIRKAINKLGLKLVRDLIITLSMKQRYQAHSEVVNERFRELWLASIKTAAIARLLAAEYTELNPEHAMLAGLVHNVGALPLILIADMDDELFDKPNALYGVMQKIQCEVGGYIFRHWHFPRYLIDVTEQCYHFGRHHKGAADYVDVIQVALVQGSIYTGLECPNDWSTVPAFDRLGIDIDNQPLDIEENRLIFD